MIRNRQPADVQDSATPDVPKAPRINEMILFKIEDGQADRLSDLENVSQRLILGQLLLSQTG